MTRNKKNRLTPEKNKSGMKSSTSAIADEELWGLYEREETLSDAVACGNDPTPIMVGNQEQDSMPVALPLSTGAGNPLVDRLKADCFPDYKRRDGPGEWNTKVNNLTRPRKSKNEISGGSSVEEGDVAAVGAVGHEDAIVWNSVRVEDDKPSARVGSKLEIHKIQMQTNQLMHNLTSQWVVLDKLTEANVKQFVEAARAHRDKDPTRKTVTTAVIWAKVELTTRQTLLRIICIAEERTELEAESCFGALTEWGAAKPKFWETWDFDETLRRILSVFPSIAGVNTSKGSLTEVFQKILSDGLLHKYNGMNFIIFYDVLNELQKLFNRVGSTPEMEKLVKASAFANFLHSHLTKYALVHPMIALLVDRLNQTVDVKKLPFPEYSNLLTQHLRDLYDAGSVVFKKRWGEVAMLEPQTVIQGDAKAKPFVGKQAGKHNSKKGGGRNKTTPAECKTCGRGHAPPCRLDKHPDCNKSSLPWAESVKGKAWLALGKETLPFGVLLNGDRLEIQPKEGDSKKRAIYGPGGSEKRPKHNDASKLDTVYSSVYEHSGVTDLDDSLDTVYATRSNAMEVIPLRANADVKWTREGMHDEQGYCRKGHHCCLSNFPSLSDQELWKANGC